MRECEKAGTYEILSVIFKSFPRHPIDQRFLLPSFYYKIHPAGVDWKPVKPTEEQLRDHIAATTSYESWMLEILRF